MSTRNSNAKRVDALLPDVRTFERVSLWDRNDSADRRYRIDWWNLVRLNEWLGDQDSNLGWRSQSPQSYH